MSTPKQTKDARREAARAQAAKLQQQQAAREKRSRNILFIALGAIVALVVVVGVVIWSQSQKTLLDSFDGATPNGADRFGGITVGANGAGSATEDAPELQIYLDAMCIHCANFEVTNGDDLTELRESDALNVIYHPVAFLDPGEEGASTRTANALATVATESPEAFVPFLDAMMVSQAEAQIEPLTDEQIADFALEAGVPQDVVDTFAARTYVPWVLTASDQARREGVAGTPTIKLDGQEPPLSGNEIVNYNNPGELRTWIVEKSGGAAGAE